VDLHPIADVCGPRLAEVREWIAEGRYPPPLAGDLVPRDYLALVDDAGGIEHLREHVEARYVITADMFGVLAGTDELGYLMAQEPELAAWEAAHPPRVDTRTPAATA